MASLSSSPATRTDSLITVPPRLSTATSVVPPPISTIMVPTASVTGRPAPMAAATGSSIKFTSRAPARPASRTARRSTPVTPLGMPITNRGATMPRPSLALRMKVLIICSAASKSAITPSRRGRTARMLPGVRPSIILASSPTARGTPRSRSMATTEGSWSTMPLPDTKISVLAVPRSIPISRENWKRRKNTDARPARAESYEGVTDGSNGGTNERWQPNRVPHH